MPNVMNWNNQNAYVYVYLNTYNWHAWLKEILVIMYFKLDLDLKNYLCFPAGSKQASESFF